MVLPIVVAVMANMTYRRSLSIQEHFSEFSGRIQESITGIHVIKSFVQERRELEMLDAGNRQNAHLNLALARVHAFFFPSLISLFILGVIGMLWTSSPYITDAPALAAQSGMITKGQLLSLVLLYRHLLWRKLTNNRLDTLVDLAKTRTKIFFKCTNSTAHQVLAVTPVTLDNAIPCITGTGIDTEDTWH